jgi:heme exporter protein A
MSPERATAITEPSLSVSGLECRRGERLVFSNLDIDLEGGEVLQISGPNGSGKTTLLRAIAGLTPPTAGEVRWCGRRIDEARIEFLRDLAYLGHADGVKAELTVWEDLEVAQALRGGGLAAADALDRLGLTELCDTLGRYLSAGQRRRLAVARILTSGARLWLLDEPFAALDEAAIATVARLLEQQAERGGLAIVTSHHPLPIDHARVLRLAA